MSLRQRNSLGSLCPLCPSIIQQWGDGRRKRSVIFVDGTPSRSGRGCLARPLGCEHGGAAQCRDLKSLRHSRGFYKTPMWMLTHSGRARGQNVPDPSKGSMQFAARRHEPDRAHRCGGQLDSLSQRAGTWNFTPRACVTRTCEDWVSLRILMPLQVPPLSQRQRPHNCGFQRLKQKI